MNLSPGRHIGRGDPDVEGTTASGHVVPDPDERPSAAEHDRVAGFTRDGLAGLLGNDQGERR